jgi:hypothetical protein
MNGKKPESQPVILSGYLGFITNRLGVHPWGQILILALLAAFYGGYRWIDKIDVHLQAVDIQLATMPLKISKDLLSEAQTDIKLGRLDRAVRAAEIVTAIIAKASVEKTKAPPDFFRETIESLDSIGSTTNNSLISTVHTAQVMLAEYRSALEPPPPPTATKKVLEYSYESAPPKEGRTTLVFTVNSNVEMIGGAPERRTFGNTDITFNNIVVEAPNHAKQTLDGIHWHNVTFVGAHIIYLGGDLDLQYVRFVNCTFNVPTSPNPRGTQFIDYTVLAQNKLTIPPKG